ncbi:unnamed protein product [Polarella glacialis]|uniref:Ribosomal RNA-processing protein 14/surfeit locus protein 6 C-terminal domain-containing protein n=1 Tax=Polarella glacialis TaxID=89957 RepID=A0A813GNR3_POLGL|nr:unnamed protein product [Polarella glacialis]
MSARSKKAQPSPGEASRPKAWISLMKLLLIRGMGALQGEASTVPRVRGEDEERPEAGRLSFDTNSAGLPFEAGIGRRGKKVRKLRDDLRKHEVDATRLREAEARGEGDVFRKEQAVQKALQRARGEKVHDDSSKLRKVQKAMDLKKKKGKDKWTAKIESEKQQVNEQQAQRRDNLKNRGSKKKTKRAGFEGKKTGYLNTDDK